MISGFARAASALGSEIYKKRAIESANFVQKYLFTENKRLLRSCYTAGSGVSQMYVLYLKLQKFWPKAFSVITFIQ
jgi:uncharacterized protein YyaL (SSP411 family)